MSAEFSKMITDTVRMFDESLRGQSLMLTIEGKTIGRFVVTDVGRNDKGGLEITLEPEVPEVPDVG